MGKLNVSGIRFPDIEYEKPDEPVAAEPEAAPEPEVVEATPEPAKPAPAPAPQITAEEIARAIRDGVRPEPAKEQPFDPEEFWSVDPDAKDKGAQLHKKVTTVIEKALAPQQDRIQQLEGALALVLASKADDPDFKEVQDEVLELINSGKVRDINLAREHVKLKRGATSAPNVPKGRAKSSTPMPPATATGPTSRASKTGDVSYKTFRDLMNDPEIQAAAERVRRTATA